jgi:hypothetical protein
MSDKNKIFCFFRPYSADAGSSLTVDRHRCDVYALLGFSRFGWTLRCSSHCLRSNEWFLNCYVTLPGGIFAAIDRNVQFYTQFFLGITALPTFYRFFARFGGRGGHEKIAVYIRLRMFCESHRERTFGFTYRIAIGSDNMYAIRSCGHYSFGRFGDSSGKKYRICKLLRGICNVDVSYKSVACTENIFGKSYYGQS